jgi:dsDNA-specific endonuclease/ATPase MutS2
LAGRLRRFARSHGPVVTSEQSNDDVVVLEIEDSIDLHTFAPRDIASVVESYVEAAAEKGLREVRLIHGRGKGVQRARVQSVLARHPLVEEFADAPATRGGWGATIAWLRPPEPAP